MEKEPQLQSRAVVYLRVNYDAVGNPDAAAAQVERQREICERYAASTGCTIVAEYLDTGRGVGLERRPELQRMLDEIRGGGIDCVIAADFARLTRNLADTRLIADTIEQAGARLVTSENADSGPGQFVAIQPSPSSQTEQSGCILPGPSAPRSADGR
jgi:DNA invertase Pin-like site-specific DNA recombinase